MFTRRCHGSTRVTQLLAERHLRDRFIHQCLRNSASACREDDFRSLVTTKLYEKRWQVVVACLDNLLPVFPFLQDSWSYEKFVEDAGSSQEAEGVEKAMSSQLFRVYIYMVYNVHRMLTDFEAWLESCACHTPDDRVHSKNRKARQRHGKRKFSERASLSRCPMKGKQGSEMAAGVVDLLLENLGSLAFQGFTGIVETFCIETSSLQSRISSSA